MEQDTFKFSWSDYGANGEICATGSIASIIATRLIYIAAGTITYALTLHFLKKHNEKQLKNANA